MLTTTETLDSKTCRACCGYGVPRGRRNQKKKPCLAHQWRGRAALVGLLDPSEEPAFKPESEYLMWALGPLPSSRLLTPEIDSGWDDSGSLTMAGTQQMSRNGNMSLSPIRKMAGRRKQSSSSSPWSGGRKRKGLCRAGPREGFW